MKKLLLPWIALFIATLSASAGNLRDIPLKDIDGKDTTLDAFSGKTILVVNVASRCGLTPQYKELEALYQKYKDQGLVVVGFPCNDFGAQEPGTNEEIKAFCSKKYAVTFPMMDKLHVKGDDRHPLYTALSGPDAKYPGDVKWNFGKFLVGADGAVIARFEPRETPDSPKVISTIEAALKEKR